MPESQSFIEKLLAFTRKKDETVSLAAANHHGKPPKVRVVRTAEGAKYYGVPIGTPIKAAKAHRANLKSAHADNPEIEDAPKASTKAPAVSIGGKPIDFDFEPHSEVYVQDGANPANAGMKFVREPDGTWHQVSATGVTTLGPAMSNIMEDNVDEDKLTLDSTHHDPSGSLPKLRSSIPDDNPDNPDLTDDDGNLKVKLDAIKDAQSKGNVVSDDKGEPMSAEDLANKPDDEPVTVAGKGVEGEGKTVPAKQAKEDLSKPEEPAAKPGAAAEEPAGDTQEFGGVQATPDQMISALEALEDSYVHNAGAGAVNQVGPAIKKRDPSNPLVGMDHKAVAAEHKAGETGNAKQAVKQAVIAALLEKLDSTNLSDAQNAKVDKVREQFEAKVNEAEQGKGLVRAPTGDGSTVQVGNHHYKPGKYSTGTGDAKTYMILHPDGTADYHSKKGVEKISPAVFEKNYTKRGMKKLSAPDDSEQQDAPGTETPKTPTPEVPSDVEAEKVQEADLIAKDTSLKDKSGKPILPPKEEPKPTVQDEPDLNAKLKAAMEKELAKGKAAGAVQTVGGVQTYDKETGTWGMNDDPSLSTPYGPAKTQPKPTKGEPTHDVEPVENANGYSVLAANHQGQNGDGYADSGLWGKFGAAGVMISHTDDQGVTRYLLVQRGKGVSSNNGKWQLPGGAINSKETDQEGAARELMEELAAPAGYLGGLTHVGEVKFEHKSGWHYNNLAATSQSMFEPIVDGSETSDAQWFTEEQIAKLDLVPAFGANMPKIVKKLKDHNDGDAKPEVANPEAPGVPVSDKKAEDLSSTVHEPKDKTNAPEVNPEKEEAEEATHAVKESTFSLFVTVEGATHKVPKVEGGYLLHTNHATSENANAKYYVDPTTKTVHQISKGGVFSNDGSDHNATGLDYSDIQEALSEGWMVADANYTKNDPNAPMLDAYFHGEKVGKVPDGDWYAIYAGPQVDAEVNAYYVKDKDGNWWSVSDDLPEDGGPVQKLDAGENDALDYQVANGTGTMKPVTPGWVMEQKGAGSPESQPDSEPSKVDVEFKGKVVGQLPAGTVLYKHPTAPIKYGVDPKTDKWYMVSGAGVSQYPAGEGHITAINSPYVHDTEWNEKSKAALNGTSAKEYTVPDTGSAMDGMNEQNLKDALDAGVISPSQFKKGILEIDKQKVSTGSSVSEPAFDASNNPSTWKKWQWSTPTDGDKPSVYAEDPDGNLWDVDENGNTVHQVTPVVQDIIKANIADGAYFDPTTSTHSAILINGKTVAHLPAGGKLYHHNASSSADAPKKVYVLSDSKMWDISANGAKPYNGAADNMDAESFSYDPWVEDGEHFDNGLGDFLQELMDAVPMSNGGTVKVNVQGHEYDVPGGAGGTLYVLKGSPATSSPVKYLKKTDGSLVIINKHGPSASEPGNNFETYPEDYEPEQGWDNGLDKHTPAGLLASDPQVTVHTQKENPGTVPVYVHGHEVGQVPPYGSAYYNSSTYADADFPDSYFYEDNAGKVYSVNPEGVKELSPGERKNFYDSLDTTLKPMTNVYNQPSKDADLESNVPAAEIPDGEGSGFQSNHDIPQKFVPNGDPITITHNGVDGEVPGGGKLYVGKGELGDPSKAPFKAYVTPEGELYQWSQDGFKKVERGAYTTHDPYKRMIYDGNMVEDPTFADNATGYTPPEVPVFIQGQLQGMLPAGGKMLLSPEQTAKDAKLKFYLAPNGDLFKVSDILGTTHIPKSDDPNGNYQIALEMLNSPDSPSAKWVVDDEFHNGTVDNQPKVPVVVKGKYVGTVPHGGSMFVRESVNDPNESNTKYYLAPNGSVYRISPQGPQKMSPNDAGQWKLELEDGIFKPDTSHVSVKQSVAAVEESANTLVPLKLHGQNVGMVEAGGVLYYKVSASGNKDEANELWYLHPNGNYYNATPHGVTKYTPDGKFDPQTTIDEMVADGEFKKDGSFVSLAPGEVAVTVQGKKVGKVPSGGMMMHPKYSSPDKTPHKLYVKGNDLYNADEYGVHKMDAGESQMYKDDLDASHYAQDTSFGPTGVQPKGFVPVQFDGQDVGMIPAGGTLHWDTNSAFGTSDPDAIQMEETTSHLYRDPEGEWWTVSADGVKKSTIGKGSHETDYNQGYYGDIAFDSSPTAPAAVEAKAQVSDLPVGYHAWAGGVMIVKGDGSVGYKPPGTDEESMLAPADVKKLFLSGQVKDQYGTSIALPGAPEQKISLFDGKPKSTQQLESLLGKLLTSDDADALGILSQADLGEDTTKAEAYSVANNMAPNIGAIKATYVHAINKILAHKKGSLATPTKAAATPSAPSFLGPFELTAEGHVKQPLLSEAVQSATDGGTMTSKRKFIASIQENNFGGTIGQGAKSFTMDDANSWLNAYQRGDMRGLYLIEKKHVPKSLLVNHPGSPGMEDTHTVAFAPELPGQLPAGVKVPGLEHIHYPSDLSEYELDQYLTGANMHLAHHLSDTEKWEFAESHIAGNHIAANAVASRAIIRQKMGDAPLSPALNSSGTSEKSKGSYSQLVDKDVEPGFWHQEAVDDYLADNGLAEGTVNLSTFTKTLIIESMLRDQHLTAEEKKAAAWDAPDGLVLKDAGTDGLVLGNNKAVKWVTDQFGDQHVLKPTFNGEEFRVEIEHEMNLLARDMGFSTPDSKLLTVDGKKAQLQRKLESIPFPSMSSLTQSQRIDLAGEHLLDHMLESDDARMDNMKMTSGGQVIGIDKGRAWKMNGTWDSLRPDVKTVEGGPTVYAGLYDQIANGSISGDEAEEIYRAVSMKAQAMMQVPDAQVRASFERAFANRPDSGVSKTDLIDKAVARKNALADDMDKLWSKVFNNAGLIKPPRPVNTPKNNQGHVLHTGITPEYLERVEANKFHGKTTFWAGSDLEDMSMIMHTEVRNGHKVTMGETKLRKPAYGKVLDFLKARAGTTKTKAATTKDPHTALPSQHDHWYAIERAARSIEVHANDTPGNVYGGGTTPGPNQATIQKMRDIAPVIQARTVQLMTQKGESDWNKATPQEKHEVEQELAMLQQYQGSIQEIERALKDGDLPNASVKAQYEYKEYDGPKKPTVKKPVSSFTVKRESSWRAGAGSGWRPAAVLSEDGESLTSDSAKLSDEDNGYQGYQYVASLKTGERIVFRGGDSTNTKASQQGQLLFEIPDGHDKAESMSRIRATLEEMGLPLTEAQPADYELFYWRHLAGIMRDRRDSKQGHHENDKYNAFWQKHDASLENKGGPEEIEMWRNAFSTFPGQDRAKIDAFVASGEHLPQFDNYDPHNPTEANSLPYWNRFDVTDEMALAHEAPHATMSAALAVALSGGSYATDSRLRQFGGAFRGMSPDSDQGTGGSNYIFLRQNQQHYIRNTNTGGQGSQVSGGVWIEPSVLRRTSNFAFNGDLFGAINQRTHNSPFDFEDAASYSQSGNEVCVKNGLSVLNAIAALSFDSESERKKALAYYKKLGITEVRGVPLEERFLGPDAVMTPAMAKKLGLNGKQSNRGSNGQGAHGSPGYNGGNIPTSWE